MKIMGEKMKEWRLETNTTQKNLAAATELSLSTIQKIERGEGGTLASLLRYLRCAGKLQVLEPFMEERRLTPVEYHLMGLKKHTKKRARK